MLLVCNYYPGVNQGAYPYEDGLTYDFCIRCQQWDVKICEENVCKGGKSRDWLASGLINATIDQCTDGLGRIMDPCHTNDPTKAPSQGLSLPPTKVTNTPVTRSPTTSKGPTPRPTLIGATTGPTKVTDSPTDSPTNSPTTAANSSTDSPTRSPSVPPSNNPSNIESQNSTNIPTETPIDSGPITDNSDIDSNILILQYNTENVFALLSIAMASAAAIVAMIGIIHAKCLSYNESFQTIMVIIPFGYLYVGIIIYTYCYMIIKLGTYIIYYHAGSNQ